MGVSFSALNLKIGDTGGDQTLKKLDAIDKKVESMSETSRAAFAKMTSEQQAAYMKFIGATEAATVAATKTVQAVAAIAPAATKSAAAVTEIGVAADGMSVRGARATQGIARGFEMVARTGNLTGRSLDAVLSNVSQLALGFGPTGLLVGAIGIATAAIVELFARTKREMEESRKKFEEEIGRMANASDGVPLMKKARDIWFGTPYSTDAKGNTTLNMRSAGAPGAYKGSLADLESSQRFLDEQMREARLRSGGAFDLKANKTIDDIQKAIDALKPKIEKARSEFRDAQTAIEYVANARPDMGMLPLISTAARDQTASQIEEERRRAEEFLAKANLAKQFADDDLRRLGVQSIGLTGGGNLGTPSLGQLMAGTHVKPKTPIPTPTQEEADRVVKEWGKLGERIGAEVASTLAASLSRGFEALFAKGGNLKDGFKAMTGALLEGLGTMFEQVGEKALIGAQFMQTLIAAISGFNPAGTIAAALGLIALGAAMKGAGSRLASGSSGGGGGYSTSHYGSNYATGATFVNPSGASSTSSVAGMQAIQPIVNHNTFIGYDDPRVQRDFLILQARANRRGSVSG